MPQRWCRCDWKQAAGTRFASTLQKPATPCLAILAMKVTWPNIRGGDSSGWLCTLGCSVSRIPLRGKTCDWRARCRRRWSVFCRPLGEQLLDDLSADLAELLVAAFVEVSELVVVQAEEMQQGYVKIADVVNFLDGVVA